MLLSCPFCSDKVKISSQISNILSYVILFDFPDSWPNIFELLSEGLGQAGSDKIVRILDTLYQAIRQITNKPGTINFFVKFFFCSKT
jgi:hypothetical protein